jgi:type II secretory pathway pseudopilin PulG
LKKKSFSLIEVTVAIVILVLVCSTMLMIFLKGLSFSRIAANKSIAYSLAEDKLEEIVRRPLDIANPASYFYPLRENPPGTWPTAVIQLEDEAYGSANLIPHFRRRTSGSWDLDGNTNLTGEFPGRLAWIIVQVWWDSDNDNDPVDDTNANTIITLTTLKANY